MGLDMYLFSTKQCLTQEKMAERCFKRRQAYQQSPEAGEAFDAEYAMEVRELAYWRKHSDLHGYLEKLYYQETPEAFQAESFNCEYLVLEREDIYDLIDKAQKHLETEGGVFEKASGYFWGDSRLSAWEDTIDVFERVLHMVDFENETVFYSSWW